ncbi:MAG: hypothetical protein ACR2KO_03960 [Geodermatophilaceae bacterium]
METVGRILVVLLLAVLIVPALLLWRLWRHAGQRRQVNEGTLGFVVPTVEAERTLARWPVRARVLRTVGLGAGLLIIVLLGFIVGTRSVFLWPLALGLGYLLGVLAGELARPRPVWTVSRGPLGRIGEYIHPGLVWLLRGTALLAVAAGVTATLLSEPTRDGSALPMSCPGGGMELVGAGQITEYAVFLLILAAAGWLVSELTLLRIVGLPRAEELDDVPVDEALRSASAHASVAAASVLTLLPLGGFALVTGLAVVGSCANSDLLSIGLIGGGLAALLAGLLVAAFLPSWLRPVRRRADVRS